MAETNATQVLHVTAGVVPTSTTRACPERTTRETVLEICPPTGRAARVGDYSLTDLVNADEVLVTGTMGGP